MTQLEHDYLFQVFANNNTLPKYQILRLQKMGRYLNVMACNTSSVTKKLAVRTHNAEFDGGDRVTAICTFSNSADTFHCKNLKNLTTIGKVVEHDFKITVHVSLGGL